MCVPSWRLVGSGRPGAGARPSALDDREDVLLADDEEVLVVDLELGPGVLRVEDLVALLDVHRLALAVVEDAARADGEDLPSWGFSFAVSGRTMPLLVISSRAVGLMTTRSRPASYGPGTPARRVGAPRARPETMWLERRDGRWIDLRALSGLAGIAGPASLALSL